MSELVLIRGLPGSGKSTMARSMAGYEHYEADMFFERYGKYCYDARKIKSAHAWCQSQTFKALAEGKRVVVSNTFTRRYEMKPYFNKCKELGIPFSFIEATGSWPNVHGVPDRVIKKMRDRWERIRASQWRI